MTLHKNTLFDEIRALIADESELDTWDIEATTGAETIYDKVVGTTRWATINEVVFKRDDEFVMGTYRAPATEMQEQDMEWSITKARPVQKTITVYERF